MSQLGISTRIKNHHIASFKYNKFILSKDAADDRNKYFTARLVSDSLHVNY